MTRVISKTELPSLYEQDETAWLEQMSQLAAGRCSEHIDWDHLSEYLSDMAIADRRQVLNRLRLLLMHLLKWEHQPHRRTGSWRATIRVQRDELRGLLESRTLRRHAQEVLAKAYRQARAAAADETGLPEKSFPARCPMTIDEALGAQE